MIKGTTIDTLKLSGKFVFLLIDKYKVKLLINVPVAQVKQVSSRYCTSTDLEEDELMKRRTSSYSPPRLTPQTSKSLSSKS